jgi:hypothetical protein
MLLSQAVRTSSGNAWAGPVSIPSNYRPLQVLNNLSVYFESSVDDQLDAWAKNFIPPCQFGFIKECGTADYGSMLSLTLHDVLERRGEGILVSLDVAGAFDRTWWARLKNRLRAKGMKGRALLLLKSYLYERFLTVVLGGKSSSEREIFSSVPQGGKWSPKLWDLDISEMHCFIKGQLFCYADDSGLWFEITDENRPSIIQFVNEDLAELARWGIDNKTTFEPSKNAMMVVSKRRVPFDPTGIVFDERRPDKIGVAGIPIKQVSSLKLVGFVFDCKLTWGPMIAAIAKKARMRLGALRRLRPLLDDANLKTMYIMFIRSIMEFGGAQFQGAAASHLDKLDVIQESAMKLGNFEIESLQSRREAATAALVFKLLDGKGRGELNRFTPTLTVNLDPIRFPIRSCSRARLQSGIRLVDPTKSNSLNQFKRSIAGIAPLIWNKLPQPLLLEGLNGRWCMIKKRAKNVLLGRPTSECLPGNSTPSTSPVRMPSLTPPDAPVKRKANFVRPKSTPNLWDQLSHYILPSR